MVQQMISPFMSIRTSVNLTSDLVQRYLTQFDAIKNEIPHYYEVLLHEIKHFVHKQTLLIAKIYFEVVISLMKYDYVNHLPFIVHIICCSITVLMADFVNGLGKTNLLIDIRKGKSGTAAFLILNRYASLNCTSRA
jgi:hypothetical protein